MDAVLMVTAGFKPLVIDVVKLAVHHDHGVVAAMLVAFAKVGEVIVAHDLDAVFVQIGHILADRTVLAGDVHIGTGDVLGTEEALVVTFSDLAVGHVKVVVIGNRVVHNVRAFAAQRVAALDADAEVTVDLQAGLGGAVLTRVFGHTGGRVNFQQPDAARVRTVYHPHLAILIRKDSGVDALGILGHVVGTVRQDPVVVEAFQGTGCDQLIQMGIGIDGVHCDTGLVRAAAGGKARVNHVGAEGIRASDGLGSGKADDATLIVGRRRIVDHVSALGAVLVDEILIIDDARRPNGGAVAGVGGTILIACEGQVQVGSDIGAVKARAHAAPVNQVGGLGHALIGTEDVVLARVLILDDGRVMHGRTALGIGRFKLFRLVGAHTDGEGFPRVDPSLGVVRILHRKITDAAAAHAGHQNPATGAVVVLRVKAGADHTVAVLIKERDLGGALAGYHGHREQLVDRRRSGAVGADKGRLLIVRDVRLILLHDLEGNGNAGIHAVRHNLQGALTHGGYVKGDGPGIGAVCIGGRDSVGNQARAGFVG